MKKIIFIILFIIGLILGLTACLINNEEKTLELTYNTNEGVPYEWKYEIEDKNIVEFVKSYEVENNNNMVGSPISINYVFKGLKKGTTTITFKYVNITDGTIEKEEKLNIKVDKNKNISLVANIKD